ncbi:MAG: transglutaminase-like domain-containing protein [Lachnospiraceae bacterium]|nr:transglutaminase-like domain-containing protein [Lachnospiraceae bacterium]
MEKRNHITSNLKLFVLLLGLLFLLFAAISCGTTGQEAEPEQDDSYKEEQEDGADWRTTGIISDYITFNNGEQEIELALCVSQNRLALYYNSEEQTLFAQMEALGVNYNCYYGGDLTAGDLTGDGCDELWLRFASDDGTDYNYIYTWNSVTSQFEQYHYTALSEINPYVIKADVKAYLSEEEITLFQSFLDGIFSQKETIELSDDYDANLRVQTAIQYSPYWFFVESDTFTDDHSALNLTYTYDRAKQKEMRTFMDNEMLNIINSVIVYPGMNELEKTLAVYGYFAEHIAYDYEWLDGLNMTDDKFLYPDIEIYQALSTGKGVCHSYAYLCEFALQQLGVECLRVSGHMTDDPESGHMWLLVKIDGEYYHCDPTWDSNEIYGCGLQYFGMTDEQRVASGVEIDYTSIDGAYGSIVCDDNRFAPFRNVCSFELQPEHQISLYTETSGSSSFKTE